MADPLTIALLAIQGITAANSLLNPPQGPDNTLGGGQLGAGPNNPAVPFAPPAQSPAGQAAAPPIDLSPQSAVIEQLAQTLAAQGPPPTVPLQGPPRPNNAAEQTVPQPTPQEQPPAQQTGPSIGSVLAATPEAIAGVSQLLGFGRQPDRTITAPIPPGGRGGQVVPGLGLPQVPSVGEILAQIPRLR